MVQAERVVNRKRRTGTVVSSGNDKTVIVSVSRASRHRLYRKVIRQTKRYAVHDPENQATVGDFVTIEETRPISKTKHWRLVEVMTERDVAEVAPESIDEALVDEVQRTATRAAVEAGAAGAGADAAPSEAAEPAQAAAPSEAPEAAQDDAPSEAAAPSEAPEAAEDDAPSEAVAPSEAAEPAASDENADAEREATS